MRYLVLATDYDGTIARSGKAESADLAAIERLRTSGRRTILLTGRQLHDLIAVCPRVSLFDYIVAENGAVIYQPRTREQVLLGERPSAAFVKRLRELTEDSIDTGQVIVSTWVPHQGAVLQATQEMGLEVQLVFNREAIMVLPAGVNKATGLRYALRKLGLSPHETVGVGDAENDHSFLEICECAVAVANAVPYDWFSRRWHTCHHPSVRSQHLDRGTVGERKVHIGCSIIERLVERSYQVCIADPEGDYGTLLEILTLGTRHRAPTVNEVLALLEDPKMNLNVNLLGIPLMDRPQYFGHLFPSLQAMRTRTGRPHWIVLDEAHHMLPAHWGHIAKALPQKLGETILLTVHPEHLAPMTLSLVDVVIAVGRSPEATMQAFADAAGRTLVWPRHISYQRGHAIAWFLRNRNPPFSVRIVASRNERIRHLRKYAEGNMRDQSFYFRGPSGRQNLKAQNLVIFSQIAEGIDEETWLFHLYRGDYSRWFRESVKDPYLADHAERIEQRRDLSPQETRNLMLSFIEARYTLPA